MSNTMSNREQTGSLKILLHRKYYSIFSFDLPIFRQIQSFRKKSTYISSIKETNFIHKCKNCS